MPYLAFDIETAINDEALKHFEEKVYLPDEKLNALDDIPPKITELKTAELREARTQEWQNTQRIRLEQSILAQRQKDIDQAPLRWWTGKIISIAVIDQQGGQHSFSNLDEAELLKDFFDYLVIAEPHGTLIGKSAKDFDFPYVIGRAMRHDLGLPEHLRFVREPFRDVNEIWGFSRTSDQVPSLKNICFGLGMPTKLMHGSEVGTLYKRIQLGDIDAHLQLVAYNLDDAQKVFEILRRYKKPYVSRYSKEASTALFQAQIAGIEVYLENPK